MFQKEYKIKSSSKLKNSERKKFIDSVKVIYKLLDSDIDKIVLDKASIYKAKAFCHTEDLIFIFSSELNPLFFQVNNDIIPTVYTLWHLPNLLPYFTTYQEVICKLVKGADLMIPGIIKKGSGLHCFGNFQKGSYCYVNTVDNKAASAVGRTHHSSEDMYMCGGHGKGIEILHIIGDSLWTSGDKSTAPQLAFELLDEMKYDPVGDYIQQHDSAEAVSVLDNTVEVLLDMELKSDKDLLLTEENEHLDMLSIEEHIGPAGHDEITKNEQLYTDDELLNLCFLHALKFSVKDDDLPILVSTLFGKFVNSYCPSSLKINMKRTSYKKVGNFMDVMAKDGLLELEVVQNGVQSVARVNREHDTLYNLKATLSANSDQDSSGGAKSKICDTIPSVEEVFFLTESVMPLFHSAGLKKGDALLPGELRTLVTNYVKSRGNLQNAEDKRLIDVDEILSPIVSKKGEGFCSQITWSLLNDRVLNQCTPGYRVITPGRDPILRRGKIPFIRFTVSKRAGNKEVTQVSCLEDFGLELSEVSKRIQRGVSCSVTTVTDNQGARLLQAQGDQTRFIVKLLVDHYKIPKKHVDRSTVDKKRK